jgi:hypothetical protein
VLLYRLCWLTYPSEYEPYYDVYMENHPEFSDRAQLDQEKKGGKE